MSRGGESRHPAGRHRLVPRYKNQGYDRESVDRRRAWVEEVTGGRLERVGETGLDTEAFRGNVENPVGTVQMPLGVAGPLRVRGEHADGVFYVPLATTEGALVRSYERGMAAITRAGGSEARVWLDRNRISPVFTCGSVAGARSFARRAEARFPELRSAAAETTHHGRLETVTCLPVGRDVIVDLEFHTGDAHGMNMLSKAADVVCRRLATDPEAQRHLVMSGYSSEKRAAGALMRGGKGKKVTAGCRLDAGTVRAVLHATPEEIVNLWHRTVLGHLAAGCLGYNGHYANGLTALFVATGQDVANVVNSSAGVTHLELDGGDLHATVTLASLSVATVGGGTGLGTSRECLGMLGCLGSSKAPKLAEITAATLLAGELSMAAALASGEFVAAHEAYGRNRPQEPAGPDLETTVP